MAAEVIGPVGSAEIAAYAAKRLAAGATVLVWDEDAEVLGNVVEGLPRTPPGRLCTWVGRAEDEAVRALVEEVLDPPVK